MDANIIPILCFGETGNVDDACMDLDYILRDIKNINFITFAYEPLEVSDYESIDDIIEDVSYIYNYLYDKYEISPNLIYGGGVCDNNIGEILGIDKLSGILVGKNSSDISEVNKIFKNIN